MAQSPSPPRLGLYEILSPIGEGGMGKVYKARDSRLGREVAVKVLPEAFAADPERIARLEREARILASLNHPNIASIYSLEECAGVRSLVMEYVDGPTLAERIGRGPIPLEDALPIARQIAEALGYAHERGVIHRDLKPANVKVTADATVKVLDFGLAKALACEPAPGDPAVSPTLTLAATRAGVILGTAAYMSPEQACGKTVDRRADIWAFGVMLYEMLAGKRLFDGETPSETLAAVLRQEPDWRAVPACVQPVLRRCLARDPKQRIHDIADARIELDEALGGGPAATPPVRRARVPWGVAGLAVALSIALAFAYFRELRPEPQLLKLQLAPPENTGFDSLAVSPDGRLLAFTASDNSGKTQLWVRPLDSTTPRPLPGTAGARHPFWSPDNRFIGFFAEDKLKKIDAAGGLPHTLCDAVNGKGGTWSAQGLILFAFEPFRNQPLYQVPAEGGVPRQITTITTRRGDQDHYWPYLLPDGRHFLFLVSGEPPAPSGIHLGALDSKDVVRLVATESGAAYAPRSPASRSAADHILFVREGRLMALPFDPRRLQIAGEAQHLAEQVGFDSTDGRSRFSVSGNGVLVYASARRNHQLFWFDRAGRKLAPVGSPGLIVDHSIAPDGRLVAVQRGDLRMGAADIWLIELDRGASSRFTVHPAYDAAPVWSPDGRRIAFFSSRDGKWSLYQKALEGQGEDERLLNAANDLVPDDFSPDGRFLLYQHIDPSTGDDLWILPTTGSKREPLLLLRTEFQEWLGQFSPDGQWIAYQSDASGRDEIYVRPFQPDAKATGRTQQVSIHGGVEVRWKGKEIFYMAPDDMLMAVEVKTGGAFKAGVPRALFPIPRALVRRYDVTPDGRRFLVSMPVEEGTSSPATVVLNWEAGLK